MNFTQRCHRVLSAGGRSVLVGLKQHDRSVINGGDEILTNIKVVFFFAFEALRAIQVELAVKVSGASKDRIVLQFPPRGQKWCSSYPFEEKFRHDALRQRTREHQNHGERKRNPCPHRRIRTLARASRCANDAVIERVTATVHVVELGLRHEVSHVERGEEQLTFGNHLYKLRTLVIVTLKSPIEEGKILAIGA